jgi:chemotaxis protein methyltransferase CheR
MSMDALAIPAFERVRRLIQDIAGIALSPTKRTMAANRLSRRLQATGHDDFASYLDLVEAPDSTERVHFVNALITNLTNFFREPHHFPTLVEHLRARGPGPAPVIWSAACSTGEEPYSIAMALAEADSAPPGSSSTPTPSEPRARASTTCSVSRASENRA